MLSIQIDQNEVKQMYMEKLKEKISEVDAELVYWDANELKRRTCMCWNTIQKEFFFDPRFPKYKVGNKWYFPADNAKQFLLQWITER
ncbi:group-specific protein [Niallia circulans]|uniref:Group-specific protein n=1 Tax=Niallia circulans TaxID=1397 RepID=A0A553SNL9_NIACI|nr:MULTISPECIES: group-specific protein [Niallia]MED3965021.1 group-specific protein [Niallia taxi]TRZ38556.1 group-specific protein [Niallia circulans]